jgi:DNA-directed RNA polymerase subunit D
MEVIQKSDDKFILRMDANESLANAIRRSVPEVPTLAIDEVEIYKNDSALYDELLVHRLGLIPLKTEKGMTSKTAIEIKLTKAGPSTVYSNDLKGPVELVHENIPITLLGDGHKIELLATARLGKGIDHAKYPPGLCYYRHLLEVKSSPEIDKIIQKAKSDVKSEKKGTKWLCDLSDAEEKQIEEIDKEAITNSNEMLFIIESYGNMPAKDIFIKAIEALQDNLDEFVKDIK